MAENIIATDEIETGQETPIDQRALIKVKPLQDDLIKSQVDNAEMALQYAQMRVVTNQKEAEDATNDLSLIAKMRKIANGYMADYTKPIKAHLDAVKTDFDSIMKPLEEADTITRQKLGDYRKEQERKVREQEAINRDKMELARREMELNGELSQPIDLIETKVHVPTVVRADAGTSGMRDNWTYEITDFAVLPNEYKVPNTSLLNSLAKSVKDTRAIPGLRIYNDRVVVVRPR